MLLAASLRASPARESRGVLVCLTRRVLIVGESRVSALAFTRPTGRAAWSASDPIVRLSVSLLVVRPLVPRRVCEARRHLWCCVVRPVAAGQAGRSAGGELGSPDLVRDDSAVSAAVNGVAGQSHGHHSFCRWSHTSSSVGVSTLPQAPCPPSDPYPLVRVRQDPVEVVAVDWR